MTALIMAYSSNRLIVIKNVIKQVKVNTFFFTKFPECRNHGQGNTFTKKEGR